MTILTPETAPSRIGQNSLARAAGMRITTVARSSVGAMAILCAVCWAIGAEAGCDDRASATPSTAPDDAARPEIYAGRVLGLDGRPVAGARLYLVEYAETAGAGAPPPPPPGMPPPAARAVTDDSGRFRFSAADMTYAELDGLPARRAGLLVAEAEGYGPDWIQTARHEAPEFLFKLPRDDVTVRGRLLDKAGRPVVGASVQLSHLDVPRRGNLDDYIAFVTSDVSRFATYDYDKILIATWAVPRLADRVLTDGDGRFRLGALGRDRVAVLRIRGLSVEETTITVMTSDRVDRRGMPRSSEEERLPHSASFVLRVGAGRTITGVVRDKASGEPIADMWVAADGTAAWRMTVDGPGDFASDAQGQFMITGVSPARRPLEVIAAPKPGAGHFMGEAKEDAAGRVVIDCPRGIPFTLNLVDEAGAPVEADVCYYPVFINPNVYTMFAPNSVVCNCPLGRAARQTDGSYRGAVLPGPGVVLAKTSRGSGFRPAHVDPKAFFAPGKTDWTAQDLISLYGNHDTISIPHLGGPAWVDQHDYSAIVLVNPPRDSGPLALSATVVADRPRQVTLVDPEGKPVVGVQSVGLTYHPWDREARLRSSIFPIVGLHPDRVRRILFVHEPRQLSGLLLARGDGDAPYTVQLRPWSTLTGRLIDTEGRPIAKAFLAESTEFEFASHDDPSVGRLPVGIETDEHGRFRAERLVPGVGYTANVYRPAGRLWGTAFRDAKVAPGRIRDLGDIRLRGPLEGH
jgi:hypothetical protein